MREIRLCEKDGFHRTAEYVNISLPCSKGEFSPDTQLEVVDDNGTLTPSKRPV